MTPIRVGVVGLGAIAQIHHLPTLERLREDAELRRVCDLSPALADAVGHRYGADATTDWRAICTAGDVDAVLLLNSGSHGPAARLALEHGKHVFAEKPLVYTRREAAELDELAQRAGRVLAVGYMKGHEAVMPAARAAVERLGELRLVRHAVYHPSETAQKAHLELLRFGDADAAGLAAARAVDEELVTEAVGDAPPGLRWLYEELALGSVVHYLSVFRALLGRLPESIAGADAWPLDLDAPPAGWGPDDVLPSLSVLARLGAGCRVELTWAWAQHYPAYEERVDVLGPAGAVLVDLPPPYVHHRTARATLRGAAAATHDAADAVVGGGYEVAFARELRAFLDAVRGRGAALAGAREAGEDAAWCQMLVTAVAERYGVHVGGEAAVAAGLETTERR